jgi:hypothetical protein
MAEAQERVRQIAEAYYGRVTSEDADVITFELPADMSGTLSMIRTGGMSPIQIGQTTRLAPRRVLDADRRMVVCPGDLVTTAFYIYRVDLSGAAPRAPGIPSIADITL